MNKTQRWSYPGNVPFMLDPQRGLQILGRASKFSTSLKPVVFLVLARDGTFTMAWRKKTWTIEVGKQAINDAVVHGLTSLSASTKLFGTLLKDFISFLAPPRSLGSVYWTSDWQHETSPWNSGIAVVERDSRPIQSAWCTKSSSLSKPSTHSYNPSSCTETI